MIAEQPQVHDIADRDALLAANEDAARFYRDQLRLGTSRGPRDYLTRRGFAAVFDHTTWTVGYAPSSWTALVEHLTALGYSDPTLLEAGLALKSRRGHLIDRFRDRVTFGIRNVQSELIGFTARSSPASPDSVPKYLNTPTTAVYRKSENLFGLGEQAERLQTGATLVLVEGPLDAVAVDLANDAESRFAPAALCGTALTEQHATQIAKMVTDDVIVSLDGDTAGNRAAENAYLRLARHLSRLTTPRSMGGSDAAETLRSSGAKALNGHLRTTVPLANRVINARLASWPNLHESAETELAALRDVTRIVARAQPTDVATLARKLAIENGFDLPTVTRELADAMTNSRAARCGPVPTGSGLAREPARS
ncbi:MAG TPA: toprim domain-containing protein [Arthrobacter sp.]|nr:toprim domain-containing protein [Arthrobacter sp.]